MSNQKGKDPNKGSDSNLQTEELEEIIEFGFGPIQTIPASIIFCANFSFSAKKP